MKMQNSDLINLPVYTQSGEHLGKVFSFEVDVDTGKIDNFHVKTGLIEGLWHQQLIVRYTQVIEITTEKMIVEDLDLKKEVPNFNPLPVK